MEESLDLDTLFVASLIHGGTMALLKAQEIGIQAGDLDGPPAEVFKFLAHHHTRYRRPASVETIRRQFGWDPPQVDITSGYLADQILDRATRAVLLTSTRELLDRLEGNESSADLVSKLEQDLRAMRRKRTAGSVVSLGRLKDELKDEYAMIQRGERGVPLPWPSLTEMTLGLWPEDLVLIGGRSGVGKSWALILCALVARAKGYRVLFVTTEMRARSIGRRAAAMAAKVPYGKVRRATLSTEQYQAFEAALQEFSQDDLIHVTGGNFNASFDQVRAAIEETEPQLLIVDGAYLLKRTNAPSGGGKSFEKGGRTEQAAGVFDELKILVKSYQIPGITSSQLNREAAGSKAEDVSEKNIALTDAAVWNSDLVLALVQAKAMQKDAIIDVMTLKYREDMRASAIRANWDLWTMKFDEIPKDGGGDADESPFAAPPSKAGASGPVDPFTAAPAPSSPEQHNF